jgi:hypothetical protein
LAKLFNKIIEKFGLKNAPSAGGRSGGAGAINRDPKAIQVKRIGYQLSQNGGGGSGRDSFEGPKVDFNTIATAIERDSYLMQSTMKYKELIFKSGYQFQGKNEQALQYLKLRLEMMAIATQVPTEELFQGIADDIVKYSNCFIVKARAKGGKGLPPGLTAIAVPPAKDPVVGYFRLPPQTIQIARDKNGNITKYKQESGSGGGDAIEFRPEDMIHIKVNVPAGEAFGLPWLAPVLDDVRLLRKVEENAALLLYRHIFPLLAYTVGIDKPGYEATNEELEELRSVIENMPTDGAIVLPERHKIEAVNITAIDGKPYLEYFENRVFSGLGMSQVDFGRGDTANRNTADAMGGNKADRVKGWQQAIQMQIDKYIIDEILIEGGFDPLVNPEYDINFVFNEIEQEMRIKVDTHEIFKFEHNIQTWEETRKNMGMEPSADESRLHFQMIGMQTAAHQASLDAQVASSKATDNKQKPSNQHGTRSGPKSSTESYSEQLYRERYPSPPEVKYRVSEKWNVDIAESEQPKVPTEKIEALKVKLESVYQQMENDVIAEIKRSQERKAFPMTDAKAVLSSIYFGKEKMEHYIQKEAHSVLMDGAKKAMTELGLSKMPTINTSVALIVVSASAKDSFDLIESTIHDLLTERLENIDDPLEAVLQAKGIFQSLRHRFGVIAKTVLFKTYHYGYVLGLAKYGVEQVHVAYEEGDCATCLEKSKEPITLAQLSSFDEVAIFNRIPPFHPNCECDLTSDKEGGES